MLENTLEINQDVEKAEINTLKKQYDINFFDALLDAKVKLEWSNKKTLCAGMC